MIKPLSRYGKKWTDLSLKELKNFARWMNDILGYHPIIIGGWAVYFYSPKMGSRDIDVVLPSWEMRDRIIDSYLKNNGYELRQIAFGEAEWVKLLDPKDSTSETYLDVCTLQDKNMVKGREIEVPWSIVRDWQRVKELEGTEIYIPDPEPLFVLKVKAAWDRYFKITKEGKNGFIKDKLRKDRFDIISLLLDCQLKQDIINDIVLKYEFKECFKDVLSRAISDQEVLDRLDLKGENIKNLKDKIKEMLEKTK
ncbi:MAG: hypothetical protein JSV09_14155 [Thermoplasmata archaeon]|nr:MAG: hypothetical protein JSV09_14155 [Thermoplasmata archaeon]